MKNIKKLFLAVAILALLGSTSCKKKYCYHCYFYSGYVIASKNGDTVYVEHIYSTTEYHDSINYYLSLGYVIDAAVGSYALELSPNGITCDTNSVYIGQPVRDSCAIII